MAWKRVPDLDQYEIARRRRVKRSRFLIDESLGPATLEFFKYHRLNALTVWQVALNGRDDQAVFAYAWKERRILLTHDDDFWNDRLFPEHRNPGLAILPGATGNQTDMFNGLVWLLWLMDREPEIWLKLKVRITRDGDVFVKGRKWQTGMTDINHYRFTPNGAMQFVP